jgi:hypothetical protein
MRIAAIGVSNEIGDSSVDCQSYVTFVIEVVGTLGLSIGPTSRGMKSHLRAPMSRSPRESCGSWWSPAYYSGMLDGARYRDKIHSPTL